MENYDIQNIIGKGKFGTVYYGLCKKSGEHVAIKIEKLSQTDSIKHEVIMMN